MGSLRFRKCVFPRFVWAHHSLLLKWPFFKIHPLAQNLHWTLFYKTLTPNILNKSIFSNEILLVGGLAKTQCYEYNKNNDLPIWVSFYILSPIAYVLLDTFRDIWWFFSMGIEINRATKLSFVSFWNLI